MKPLKKQSQNKRGKKKKGEKKNRIRLFFAPWRVAIKPDRFCKLDQREKKKIKRCVKLVIVCTKSAVAF